eukprot:2130219-Rhodomonas_salina.3
MGETAATFFCSSVQYMAENCAVASRGVSERAVCGSSAFRYCVAVFTGDWMRFACATSPNSPWTLKPNFCCHPSAAAAFAIAIGNPAILSFKLFAAVTMHGRPALSGSENGGVVGFGMWKSAFSMRSEASGAGLCTKALNSSVNFAVA